jgi:hypothetical protein
MAAIRLLIDEDVRPLLAETLRQRGFDAQHVDELQRSGLSDAEQLAFAVQQLRAIITHNIRDYVLLDREYRAKRRDAPRHLGERPSVVPGVVATNDALSESEVRC